MKQIFILLFALSVISCGESFMKIDTEKFNTDIAENTNIKSPEELITIFYNYPNSEGKPNLRITTRKLKENVFEVTLIHDNQQDDSQKAEKIVMIAKKIGNKWNADKISKNWKCYNGRGHTDWGTEYCN